MVKFRETLATAVVYLKELTNFLPDVPEDLEDVVDELSGWLEEKCPHGLLRLSGSSCGICDGTYTGLKEKNE